MSLSNYYTTCSTVASVGAAFWPCGYGGLGQALGQQQAYQQYQIVTPQPTINRKLLLLENA